MARPEIHTISHARADQRRNTRRNHPTHRFETLDFRKPQRTAALTNSPAGSDELDHSALKNASRIGIVVNYGAQFLKFFLQFVYQVLLARLLLPQDFGVVAMAAPVLAFVALLADLGLSQAVVQREKVTGAEVNFLFWFTVGLTGVITAITILVAPLIAQFYNEPRVSSVVIVLGLLMFVGSLSAQHGALLNRRLAFRTLAVIDLTSFSIAAFLGLAAAWAGFGLWSIVINLVAVTCISGVLLWLTAGWLPGKPKFRNTGGGSLLRFGSDIAAFNFANFFARNLDNILIGHRWGDVQLGLYDRAYRLLLLPLGQVMGPITKVAIPLLSRVGANSDAYKNVFVQLVDLIVLMTYPGAIWAIVMHEQVILTLLGANWVGASPIFAILSVGALFAPLSTCTNWLLLTQDRTAEMRNYGLISSIGFAIAIVAGLSGGPVGVATSYIAFGVVQGPIVWWLTTRRGAVDHKLFVRILAPHLIASLPVFVLLYVARGSLPNGLLGLGAMLAASYFVFLAVILAQPAGRARLMKLVVHGREMLGKAQS